MGQGAAAFRVVPVHKVLVPVEWGAVCRLGKQDNIVARLQVFQPQFSTDLLLRCVINDFFYNGVCEVLLVWLSVHLLPETRRVNVNIAALVAVFGIDGHGVKDALRPALKLAE